MFDLLYLLLIAVLFLFSIWNDPVLRPDVMEVMP